MTDYKTANIADLQEFLSENAIDIDEVFYCDYEQRYFSAGVKSLQDDDGNIVKTELREWIPTKYNDAFQMVGQDIEKVDSTTDMRWVDYQEYDFE